MSKRGVPLSKQSIPRDTVAPVSNLHVRVDAKTLAEAVKRAGYGIAGRANLPMLRHLLLRAEGGSLHIRSTDLSVYFDTQISAEVQADGEVAVPFNALRHVLKNIGGPLVLTAAASDFPTLGITAGRFEATLNCLPAAEFPLLPVLVPTQQTLIAGLTSMLAETVPMAAWDDNRPIIAAVNVEATRFVATDTHRLVFIRHDCGAPFWNAVLVPVDTCVRLQKMLGCQMHDDIAVEANASIIKFTAGSTTVQSRRVGGVAPAYDKIVPTKHSGAITVNPASLLEATRWAIPVAQENSNRLVLSMNGELLKIRAEAHSVGIAESECSITSEGKWSDFKIALSARYLIDGLLLFAGCSEVSLKGSSQVDPVVITSDERPEVTYVVMPMQYEERTIQ